MIDRRFILETSFKSYFLIECGLEIHMHNDKPLLKFVEEDHIPNSIMMIAIMKWEIHHALNLEPVEDCRFSINQLVDKALNCQFENEEDYKEHVLLRQQNIAHLLKCFDTECEEAERDEYLNNNN